MREVGVGDQFIEHGLGAQQCAGRWRFLLHGMPSNHANGDIAQPKIRCRLKGAPADVERQQRDGLVSPRLHPAATSTISMAMMRQ